MLLGDLRLSKCWAAASALIVLSGCIAMAPIELDSEAKTFVVDPDKSLIYIVRPARGAAWASNMSAWIEGKATVRLPYGTFARVAVDPGTYNIRGALGGDAYREADRPGLRNSTLAAVATIETKPGEVYVFQLWWGPGAGPGGHVLELVPGEEGNQMVRDYRMVLLEDD